MSKSTPGQADYSEDIQFLRERIVELEATVEQQQDRIDELEQQVTQIDDRTDLFNLIDSTDSLDAEQRSAALLQHMFREAQQSDGRTTVTRDKAETILHNPDIDRTTYYTDFRRCVDMLDDERVCQYRGDADPARLELDLTAGSIPARFHGDRGD